MRQGDEVYYFTGDHLGSVSLTTDSAGNVIDERRYLPYGGDRWSDGSAVTDFGFTGQREEIGFGLVDYNARYYSPVLGRFVSADTIVPNPRNSQDLNRYLYTRNNPLRYIDPSGHCIVGFSGEVRMNAGAYGTSGICPHTMSPGDEAAYAITEIQNSNEDRVRLKKIHARAAFLARQSQIDNSGITALEAMAQITEYAAPLYGPQETNAFVRDMAELFVGFSGLLAPLYAADSKLPGAGLWDYGEFDPSSEFTIYGPERTRLEDSGFAFKDGSSQPRHFWFAVELEMNYPTFVNGYQAYSHENPKHWLGGSRGSQGDTNLSLQGGILGRGLDDGSIKPSEVGAWLRVNLGENQ